MARPSPTRVLTLPTSSPDLFAHRNRLRIVAVVVLATLNYVIASALAAFAVVLGIIVLAILRFEVFPDDLDTLRLLGIGVAGILVLAFVVGGLVAIVRIPFRGGRSNAGCSRRPAR